MMVQEEVFRISLSNGDSEGFVITLELSQESCAVRTVKEARAAEIGHPDENKLARSRAYGYDNSNLRAGVSALA